MSVDPACPHSLRRPEASNSRESSPMPEIYGPQENYVSLQMSSAETHDMETVSPLPSFSMDLLIQDSPDSSTSPRVKLLARAADKSTEKKEEKVLVKKQKTRTVFSQMQLCVLNDRFQRQKYLSLQQMQELSNILNLSYKQVKTWFQNQRMKCKRWQKNNWLRNSNIVTQGPATTEYPGFFSYHQGCLVNSSGNLPMWGNQTWNNPTWSNQSWNSQSWSNQSWNSQTWCSQAWNNQTWNNQFNNYVEEFLQPQIQFQQNFPVSDLEVTLETAGESYNIIQQTAKYFSSQQQIMDLFPNYSLNIQPEDL
ncbi:LOW QUALITY PROTEIN: homeobox protein NANOG-like [Physeter macrocephalus]|uniref:LOW QUALITY PROTEIN: homeobox protein NANOG-like n=1 Tax=Physeter macrocephalus TaxID=9755 RepID=A0A2Y9S2X6_PHYMC|nr:LOW QUALITY PROTEIN: homeobox protein NANOG-like [Physeter catodon]|eukprot:XP_023972908.1 LOW QUALITY PROTEIN: homeobox protein NANOG-like [Physeter catodon]